MQPVHDTTWPEVIIAAVVALPATIAAISSLRNGRHLPNLPTAEHMRQMLAQFDARRESPARVRKSRLASRGSPKAQDDG